MDWLKVDEVSSMLNTSNNFLAYKKFVAAGVDRETQEFYDKKNMPVILGSQKFKEKILSDVEEKQLMCALPDYNKTKYLPRMNDIDRICAVYFNVDKSQLLKVYGKGNVARHIAIYGGRAWAKEMLSVIADHYHCQSHSGISKIVKNINQRMAFDVLFADEIEKIRNRVFFKKYQMHT